MHSRPRAVSKEEASIPTLGDLEDCLVETRSAIVAFSGGVDSSLVAAAAVRVLGERSLAVTAVSPALATGELDGARRVARTIGIAHEEIRTDELAAASMRCSPARTWTISVTGARGSARRPSTMSGIRSSKLASASPTSGAWRGSSGSPVPRSPRCRASPRGCRSAPRSTGPSWRRSTGRSAP
ncbi:MAG: hypothetical protein E6G65_05600 [Actinobacteria bacterium]|nr:MAG: hypothetical protein E6G65_05600 [Actinomycetota bacterium]